MPLRERQRYDELHPVTARGLDAAHDEIAKLYDFSKSLEREIKAYEAEEDAEPVDEKLKEMAQVHPDVEKHMNERFEKDKKILKNMAEDLKEDKRFSYISAEKFDEIIEEITNKEGLEDPEFANAFFEEQWNKIKNYRIKKNKPLKPKYLDSEQPEQDPFKDPNEYTSMALGDFLPDQENYDKMHEYEQERIGRYPHGFRHLENFANYSQERRDATI